VVKYTISYKSQAIKDYVFIILILTTLKSINAFTQSIEWEKNYGGSEDEQFSSLQQTADGGYIGRFE